MMEPQLIMLHENVFKPARLTDCRDSFNMNLEESVIFDEKSKIDLNTIQLVSVAYLGSRYYGGHLPSVIRETLSKVILDASDVAKRLHTPYFMVTTTTANADVEKGIVFVLHPTANLYVLR